MICQRQYKFWYEREVRNFLLICCQFVTLLETDKYLYVHKLTLLEWFICQSSYIDGYWKCSYFHSILVPTGNWKLLKRSKDQSCKISGTDFLQQSTVQRSLLFAKYYCTKNTFMLYYSSDCHTFPSEPRDWPLYEWRRKLFWEVFKWTYNSYIQVQVMICAYYGDTEWTLHRDYMIEVHS